MDFIPRMALGQTSDPAGAIRVAANIADSKRPVGTHEHKIDDDQRARRRVKSVRTASHSGNATRPKSSSYSRVH
jgi:hypothetical protein